MDLDLGIDGLLEPDSDLVLDLCESLEEQDIHLTGELLAQILQEYESYKLSYFKEMIENLVGPEELDRLGGPSVVQVVMEPKGRNKGKKDTLDEVDTDYLS